MRTFRRAALAGATAIALTVGASAVAVAETDSAATPTTSNSSTELKDKFSSEKKDEKGSTELKDKFSSEKKDEKGSTELKDKLSSDKKDEKGSSEYKDKLSSEKKDGEKGSSSDFTGLGSSDNCMNEKRKKPYVPTEAKVTRDYASDLSSKVGKCLEGRKPVDGRQVFGSEIQTDIAPWARIMRLVTVTSLLGSFFGLVVFPIYNFLKFNNWVR